MATIVRLGNQLITPMVEAKAVLPLPLPPDAAPAGDGEVIELELLTIQGPPSVVASALDALASHLDDLVPTIGTLYDDHRAEPNGG
ncbi:hypothetical protein HCA58_05275 [Micromonospora sp. HNM0581]|uniref:hypothetical protein n=1 Tax=Micromonospora sp. HNM0581 TaxID=2716341 RepID=UPI001469D535|nr:hypothetical protein [Micromonospora sp. HNM0581]NLU77817.1 hypothetical protein [Micromonospora sp. HNM0581]